MTVLVSFILIAGLIGVDQFLKWIATQTIMIHGEAALIPDILVFKYRENTGAAFSIFENHTALLSLLTAVVLAVGLFVIFRCMIKDPFIHWTLCVIIAGGIGNLIDRICRGYVIDFIYFKPIDFPIFNFADILVVCGEIFLIIYILFFFKKKEAAHGKN